MARIDGYKELANAIVLQAVDDYRNAILQNKTLEDAFARGKISDDSYLWQSRFARRDIRELQRFFKSSWCSYLSDLNCENIAERLKNETLEFMRLSEIAVADKRTKGIDRAAWKRMTTEEKQKFDNVFRCPFCGGQVDMRYRFLHSKYGWVCVCKSCLFKTKHPEDKKKGDKK